MRPTMTFYCGLPGAQVCSDCDTTDWSCNGPACEHVSVRPPWGRRRYHCQACDHEFYPRKLPGGLCSRYWQKCPKCGKRRAPIQPWRTRQ